VDILRLLLTHTTHEVAALKEQGYGFGMVLTAAAVILAIGAVWFALTR